jgi:hypothetical protein
MEGGLVCDSALQDRRVASDGEGELGECRPHGGSRHATKGDGVLLIGEPRRRHTASKARHRVSRPHPIRVCRRARSSPRPLQDCRDRDPYPLLLPLPLRSRCSAGLPSRIRSASPDPAERSVSTDEHLPRRPQPDGPVRTIIHCGGCRVPDPVLRWSRTGSAPFPLRPSPGATVRELGESTMAFRGSISNTRPEIPAVGMAAHIGGQLHDLHDARTRIHAERDGSTTRCEARPRSSRRPDSVTGEDSVVAKRDLPLGVSHG